VAADARHESATGVSRDRAEHGDLAVSAADRCDQRCGARSVAGARGLHARFGYRRLNILLEREACS
jgi:hypothetical protein